MNNKDTLQLLFSSAKALNKIDDYLEYRALLQTPEEIKMEIMSFIDEYTNSIKDIKR
jgi:hypothetical protein